MVGGEEAMGHRCESDSEESRRAKIIESEGVYAAALLSGDGVAAEIAIREAMDAQLTTAEIDDEIIAPALWLVGELWERGEISVADEHIATEISIRVLALQREAQRVAQARGSHRILLAAAAGELHVVALRMVGNLLHEAGYDTVMLGANVPADALGASARRYQPDVICLSSTVASPAGEVMRAIGEVHQQWPAAGFVVGGRGLLCRVRSRSGIDVCKRVSDVVEAVDAMVKRASLN
jgi:methanogenic corrinoid protein MtbC1